MPNTHCPFSTQSTQRRVTSLVNVALDWVGSQGLFLSCADHSFFIYSEASPRFFNSNFLQHPWQKHHANVYPSNILALIHTTLFIIIIMIIIIIISVIIALSRLKVGLPALCSGRKIFIFQWIRCYTFDKHSLLMNCCVSPLLGWISRRGTTYKSSESNTWPKMSALHSTRND